MKETKIQWICATPGKPNTKKNNLETELISIALCTH